MQFTALIAQVPFWNKVFVAQNNIDIEYGNRGILTNLLFIVSYVPLATPWRFTMNGTSSKLSCREEADVTERDRMISSRLCDPTFWVDKYGDSLFRYAVSWVRDAHAAEDLVQETFLAALSSQDSFTGESSEGTWLFGILKHKIMDHYRAAKRHNTICDLEKCENDKSLHPDEVKRVRERTAMEPATEGWQIHPGICIQQKAFWDVLQQCLSKVSPRLASAFALREIEQLDTSEICASLNVSEGNLWVMLHRARTALRRCLHANWLNRIG